MLGELAFRDFWRPHNAHRIVFPKLIILPLGWFSHWNHYFEALVNFALGIATLGGLLFGLAPAIRSSAKSISSPTASPILWSALIVWFTLSLSQYENWLWGLQIQLLLFGATSVWGIAVAEADPEAHVTAQDFPALFDLTRHYTERHGVADRYDYLPGDLKTVDFGEERFDLALLGNIVHSEGVDSSRNLFGRLHKALKPGGRIVVIDMIPGDERTGPPFPLLFALTMLLMTEKGGT